MFHAFKELDSRKCRYLQYVRSFRLLIAASPVSSRAPVCVCNAFSCIRVSGIKIEYEERNSLLVSDSLTGRVRGPLGAGHSAPWSPCSQSSCCPTELAPVPSLCLPVDKFECCSLMACSGMFWPIRVDHNKFFQLAIKTLQSMYMCAFPLHICAHSTKAQIIIASNTDQWMYRTESSGMHNFWHLNELCAEWALSFGLHSYRWVNFWQLQSCFHFLPCTLSPLPTTTQLDVCREETKKQQLNNKKQYGLITKDKCRYN
jgi:hypothetical protein